MISNYYYCYNNKVVLMRSQQNYYPDLTQPKINIFKFWKKPQNTQFQIYNYFWWNIDITKTSQDIQEKWTKTGGFVRGNVWLFYKIMVMDIKSLIQTCIRTGIYWKLVGIRILINFLFVSNSIIYDFTWISYDIKIFIFSKTINLIENLIPRDFED